MPSVVRTPLGIPSCSVMVGQRDRPWFGSVLRALRYDGSRAMIISPVVVPLHTTRSR